MKMEVKGREKESEGLKAQNEQASKDIDVYRAQLQELTAKYDSLMQYNIINLLFDGI